MRVLGIGLLVLVAAILVLTIIATGIQLFKHELTWKEVFTEFILEALNPFNWF